jgi:hypothetical protein
MNDKKINDFTTGEKLDVVLEVVANITLFLFEKYPDYHDQVKNIRIRHDKELMEKLGMQMTEEILKKLKGEE